MELVPEDGVDMGVKHLASFYEPVSGVWPGWEEGCEWEAATSAMAPASLEEDAEYQDLFLRAQ